MPQLSFEQLCNLINTKPLQGAIAAQNQHRCFRTREYELAALAFALALRLRQDPASLSSFYGLPFFNGGYTPNAAQLLLHCQQFVYEDRRGPESGRAGEHARAMKPAFDAGWTAYRLLEALKNSGGFSGLEALFPRHQAGFPTVMGKNVAGHPNTVSQHPTTDGSPTPDNEQGGLMNGGFGAATTPPVLPSKPNRRRGQSAGRLLERYLMVEMQPPSAMASLFGLKVGESRHFRVTRGEDEPNGFIVFNGFLDASPGIRPLRQLSGSDAAQWQGPGRKTDRRP